MHELLSLILYDASRFLAIQKTANTMAKALNGFELMEEMGQDQCCISDFGIYPEGEGRIITGF